MRIILEAWGHISSEILPDAVELGTKLCFAVSARYFLFFLFLSVNTPSTLPLFDDEYNALSSHITNMVSHLRIY